MGRWTHTAPCRAPLCPSHLCVYGRRVLRCHRRLPVAERLKQNSGNGRLQGEEACNDAGSDGVAFQRAGLRPHLLVRAGRRDGSRGGLDAAERDYVIVRQVKVLHKAMAQDDWVHLMRNRCANCGMAWMMAIPLAALPHLKVPQLAQVVKATDAVVGERKRD